MTAKQTYAQPNKGWAKLTDDEVRQVRTSTQLGCAIAKQFGVHPSTVTRIKKHKTYKRVDYVPSGRKLPVG